MRSGIGLDDSLTWDELAGSRPPRSGAAPPGLVLIFDAFPALTRWASLCRRYAA